jgi:nitroimidazol reductase NimA-like FMN-containing flavoprotein (pyridoxamine 5'-phosphate oxidase superfamily)
VAEQRRMRSIAMTPAERDAFLASERTCRVASVGPAGPHVSPLWFHWDGQALWLYSLTRSQRWANIEREPHVSVVVDAGHDYGELRGVQINGIARLVGEAPRTDAPVAELEAVERAFAAKYRQLDYDERHAWLRVEPRSLRSWDFRKMPSGA